jgi:hypothetical protein
LRVTGNLLGAIVEQQRIFPPMIFFWIVFGVDVIAAAVIVYFFFIGLADGSVSSFNMGLWLAIFAGTAAILGGGWAMNAKGQRGAAIAVLSILAVPSVLFGLFMLLLVITQPNWH